MPSAESINADGSGKAIGSLIGRMDTLLAPMAATNDNRLHFLTTYRNTTEAVSNELAGGGFVDATWLERLDIVFASLYLDALDAWNRGESCSEPWRVAFEYAKNPKLPVLRHVLLGMNAHINYDLPLALLDTISDEEFANPAKVAIRERDHSHINVVLLRRVAEEDDRLAAQKGGKTLWEKMKQPLERAATGRLLKEARTKVWANAKLMAAARTRGDDAEVAQLRAELSTRSAEKLRQLTEAREVLLELAMTGFGVMLPGSKNYLVK